MSYLKRPKDDGPFKRGERIKLCDYKWELEKSGKWKYEDLYDWLKEPVTTFEIELSQKQPDGRYRVLLRRPHHPPTPPTPKDCHDFDCAVFITLK